MTTPARRRLLNDYKKYQKEAAGLGVLIKLKANNMMICEAVIFGPDDTEWESGVFRLRLEFTDTFPQEPPKVQFLTKMFHPNIYANGNICLDLLDKAWTPLYDYVAILTSIQSLLTDPNPDSPANTQAAELFVEGENDKSSEYY